MVMQRGPFEVLQSTCGLKWSLVLILTLCCLIFGAGLLVGQIRFQPIPVASPVASQLKPSFESVWLLATEIGQAKGDIKTVYPGSDSMAPTIRPWHRMVTAKVQLKNLQINDIIIVYQWQPFRYGGRELVLVGHRIVEIGNDEQGWWAVTKGDNNDWPDGTLRRGGDICCKVIGVLY